MGISSWNKKTIYLLFALSGFCALVYEILWTKYLSLTFGTTMLAVSVVAATFMGGLALGSYLLGRYADRESNILRIYAFLELGIALTALLFAPTLQLVEMSYVWLSMTLPAHPAVSVFFHFTFSAILLLPPATLMGGTFPLMCRFFARKKCGGQIGRLYALNTLGATVGTLSAGFLLIPKLGLSATGHIAIAGNLVIAAVSFLLSRRFGQTTTRDISQIKRSEQPLIASRHRLVLIGIGLVGFFSLAYEILWTRVFLLFLGNTTYAFALMLGVYLVGISLGGAIYARKVRPDLNEKKVFITLTALMGLSIAVTAPFYDRLAYLFQIAHETSGDRWGLLSLLSFLIVFAVMGLPTILSGSLLPAAVAILDPGKNRTGEGVGLVVLHNTIGAVFGSLVAGFVLIPTFGLYGSFRLVAGLNLLLAAILYLRFWKNNRPSLPVPALALCGLLLILLPLSWKQNLMTSGVYYYAAAYAKLGGIQKALAGERLLEHIEGIDTTVAVKASPDGRVRFLSVNGKTDASSLPDMPTQLLIGQLPLLLHADPRDALVIGFGSGITVGGIKDYPLARLDCVEISPGVIEASRHFERENRSALRHPKLNLKVDDGRNFLLSRDQRYDVIISQPSNPWQTGNANLFTHEFYQLGASRLREGGVFCQWIGLYDITPENLRILSSTFLGAFPHVLAFKADSDLILIGSRHKVNLDYKTMERRMNLPGLRSSLAGMDIRTPGDLIGKHFAFSESTIRRFANNASLNTDDHPALEYSYQHNLGGKAFGELQRQNLMTMEKIKGRLVIPLTNAGRSNSEIARSLRDIGQGYSKVRKQMEARYFFNLAADYEGGAATAPSEDLSEEG